MGEFKNIALRILLFSSPFLLIIGSYIALDPFKVLFDYSLIEPSYKNVVTDFMRTEELLDNYKKEEFNTFTLGNSQIQAFQKAYPAMIPGASYADLHNPGESVWNLYKKVKLVDSLGLKMDHVLMIMNAPLIENVRNSNPAYVGTKYIHHPLTSGQSWWDFQIECFGFYLADFYFIKYLDYNIFQTYRPYMKGIISAGKPLYEKAEVEQSEKSSFEPVLENNFYNDQVEKHPVLTLDSTDKELLYEVQAIFKKHSTTLCLVFPPNERVEKIDLGVLREIQAIFGEAHVFDFTGKNSVIHSDADFIDDVHFKPAEAQSILKEIQASGFEY